MPGLEPRRNQITSGIWNSEFGSGIWNLNSILAVHPQPAYNESDQANGPDIQVGREPRTLVEHVVLLDVALEEGSAPQVICGT